MMDVDNLVDELYKLKLNEYEFTTDLHNNKLVSISCSKGLMGTRVYLSKEDIKDIIRWAYDE